MHVGFTQLDQDVELDNFNKFDKQSNSKKKVVYVCMIFICMLIISLVYTGIISGFYIHNLKNNKQYINSICYVNNIKIIDLCDEQITTKYCFTGEWYIDEKHYDVLYRMRLIENDNTRFESKKYVLDRLNEHPVGTNNTCWYHIDNGELRWKKPQKAKVYFNALWIGGSILGIITCLISILLIKLKIK